MNKVILIGRLTKDPELRYAAGSGTAVCRFTVAINRQFKKDETDFINCVAFGKTGVMSPNPISGPSAGAPHALSEFLEYELLPPSLAEPMNSKLSTATSVVYLFVPS